MTCHRRDEDAGAVLDATLAEGDPVVLMGNTIDDFMRDMEVAIADWPVSIARARRSGRWRGSRKSRQT